MKIDIQNTKRGKTVESCKFTEDDIFEMFDAMKGWWTAQDKANATEGQYNFVQGIIKQLTTPSKNKTKHNEDGRLLFKWNGLSLRNYEALQRLIGQVGINLDLSETAHYDHSENVDRQAIFDEVFGDLIDSTQYTFEEKIEYAEALLDNSLIDASYTHDQASTILDALSHLSGLLNNDDRAEMYKANAGMMTRIIGGV